MLAVLALVAAGALWAATIPELTTTEVYDGQRVYLSGAWIAAVSESNPDGLANPSYYLGALSPNAQKDSLVLTQFKEGVPGSSYTFTLEAAGKKIKGIDAYYIKNDYSGKYLSKGAGEYYEGYFSDLYLADKAEATAWAIFKAADHTDLTGYSGARDIPDEAMHIMALGEDGSTPYYVTYNGVFSLAYKKMYPDMFWFIDQTMVTTAGDAQAWIRMETVASQENPFDELQAAVVAGREISRPGGTDPGFYNSELIEALAVCLEEAANLVDEVGATEEQAKNMIAQLNQAIEAVTSCKPNPMVDGYYYLVNGAYDLNALEEDGVKLAIRDGEQGSPNWHLLDSKEPAYVWHVTKRADGYYDMQNLLTGLYIDVAQNGTIAMAATSTKGVGIELLGTDATFALTVYDGSAKTYTPMYANNYTQTGLYNTDGSTLVLRSSGSRTAASWYLNTVPADQLALLLEDAPTAQLRKELSKLIERGAALYAAAVAYESSDNLITDVSQLECNAAMGPESEWGEDGGGLAALIDNDESTFFHTAWTDNIPTETVTDDEGNEISVAQKHWLAITLPEAMDKVSFVFTRRAPTNDNSPSDFDLLGSNDEVNWTPIFEGYNNFDPTLTATTVIPDLALGAKYSMLRMVVNHTDGSRGIDRKSTEGDAIYWNLAELKVCTEVHLAPDCQAASMPAETVKGLAEALGKARKALSKPTQADIDALQTAYDAFKAVYVDATPLLTLIQQAENVNNTFETGNGLGFYAEGTPNPLPELISQARTVVEETAYTAATINEQMTKLNQALATIGQAMQQTPDPTKYYTLHFPEMGDYEVHGWEVSDAVNEEQGTSLFGRQAFISASAQEELDEDAVRSGACVYFSDERISAEEMGQFRFIPRSDGSYLMQNRATGLYLHGSSTGYNRLTMAHAPSPVRIKGLSCGKLQIEVYEPDGTLLGNLYALLYGTQLGLSTLTGLGSNSALELHEVEGETVAETDMGNTPVDVQVATYQTMCYPVSVSCDEGQMYTVAGLVKEGNAMYIGMKNIKEVRAGEPFVYVLQLDGISYTSNPTAEDILAVEFFFGQELAAQPLTVNGLKGSYTSGLAVEGESVLRMDAATGTPKWVTVQKNSAYNDRVLNAYSASLPDWSELPDMAGSDADLLIAIDEAGVNAIGHITWAEPDGYIYDLSGRRVNLLNAKRSAFNMNKGIYIRNGKKFILK